MTWERSLFIQVCNTDTAYLSCIKNAWSKSTWCIMVYLAVHLHCIFFQPACNILQMPLFSPEQQSAVVIMNSVHAIHGSLAVSLLDYSYMCLIMHHYTTMHLFCPILYVTILLVPTGLVNTFFHFWKRKLHTLLQKNDHKILVLKLP